MAKRKAQARKRQAAVGEDQQADIRAGKDKENG